jgi:hypothetical protein
VPMNANANILIVVLNSYFERQGNNVHFMRIDTPPAGASEPRDKGRDLCYKHCSNAF